MIHEIGPEVLHGVEFITISFDIVFIDSGDDIQTSLLHDITEVNERIGLRRRSV